MLLLKNVKLYGEKLCDLLIAGGQISAIGENLDVINAFIVRKEMGGATVIPALIDQHVHVTGGGGEGGMNTRCPELAVEDIVAGGVGTLVGLLGTDGITRNVENLIAKTKGLKEYGFNAYCLTGAYEVPSPTLTGSVMKDIAFIDECIGLKIAISDHRCSHPSVEELIRLAGAVRMGGIIGKKPGVMHIHVGAGKRGISQIFDIIETEFIPASVFRPTHMNKRLDEAVKLTELGSYADITTGTDLTATAKTMVEAISRAKSGYITMSSDSNGSIPKWNEKKEMIGIGIGQINTLYGTVRTMVKECGFTLREALASCTENVARSLDMYPYVGAIAEGSRADVLVLDDELNIRDFILKGEYVMEDYKRTLRINFVD